jgi:cytochrome c oxidase cbb3-type subunit III
MFWISILVAIAIASVSPVRTEQEIPTQAAPQAEQEAAATPAAKAPNGRQLYAKYCATCHGANGEGHITEHANALRSRSFLSTVTPYFLDHAIRFGRANTAMAGYSQSVGGPLTDPEIQAIVKHVQQFANLRLTGKVEGDATRGADVYKDYCARCHGPTGAGGSAPSLNDSLFLYTADARFLRYAIMEGRDDTAMPAFRHVLTPEQINDVTAHIRSWGSPWIEPAPVRLKLTSLDTAVLHPNGQQPAFGQLREGRYISPQVLKEALDRGTRLILLDVRATSAWARGHIQGAVPFAYHDVEQKAAELPNDDTWIVAYCACPTHLSDATVDTLRKKGFKNTAVLDGGLAAWVAKGYPLASGIVDNETK